MEVVLDFIVKYWKYILFACFGLIEIILLIVSLCKKKVVLKTDLFARMFSALPGWIIEAEKTGEVGTDKLVQVLRKCLDFLHDETGLSVNSLYRLYGLQIMLQIEDILSTPQKKEVNDEKENK